MKNKFLSGIMLGIIFSMVSCELPDNVDPKGLTTVPADALFGNAQIAWVDQLSSINVNNNISRLLAQYNAQIIYVDEGNFNFSDRRIPDSYYTEFYRDVLIDLKDAKSILNETEAATDEDKQIIANKIAIIDIIEVYTYQVLVDAFGNIPYTEALKGIENPSPKYDDAQTIYLDLLNRLNNSISKMDVSVESFTKNDLLFKGDVSKWYAFANSLKLRMALRISDVPSLSATAKKAAEEAIAAGVITNKSQNATFVYLGVTPYTSSIYKEMVEGGRQDFVPSVSIVDIMNSLNDPRSPQYFTQVDTSTEAGIKKLVFIGGNPGDQNNSWASCSHFSDTMFGETFPFSIIDVAEVEFLLAEAAMRGYTGTSDAQSHYNNAIIASIISWGGTLAQANAYISQANVAFDAANWKRSIGIQKWIALYDRGIEGWAEIRRLDIDDWTQGPLVKPANSKLNANPKRMPYPYIESDVNKTNKEAASTAIGGDSPLTNIFWDID